MNTEEIKKLVENLEKLNLQEISTKKENFFDICGYPHYENVVSNVIVYFLNESSYKQLFLESILKCLNIESNEILVSEAEREVVVDENKRIDILMETQKYAIAIENKIYAGDQGQPYEKYKKYLKDNFKDKEKKMVLLSIFKKDENSKDKHLDHCITYRELLEKIKSKIGEYVNDVKIEETILLKNFINNLENIMGNSNRNINDTNCNILFKNTLYDENASCHLAIGEGFPECIEGGFEKSKEELLALGLNMSHEHVDFFIGTNDLEIKAVLQNGRETVIMKDGNFVEV